VTRAQQALVAALAALSAACGPDTSAAEGSPPPRAAPRGTLRPGSGALRCTVRLAGAAPRAPRIAPDKNVEHCGAELLDPVLVVAADGGVANAVVALVLEGGGGEPAAPADVHMRNEGCLMEPRVQTARPGARVVLSNRDPIPHNPHAWDEDGLSVFNVTLLDQELEVRRKLERPGLYRIDCDTHSWMHAYVHVFDHPWHAVTDASGVAELSALPAGARTLRVWHEVLGERVLAFEAVDGATGVLEVELELADRRAERLVPPGMQRPWIARAAPEASR
jgi:plastocyanin